MSEKSGKPTSIIQVIAVVLVIATIWLNFNERISKLEKRIVLLEADAKTLAPLSDVMRGYQPNRATPHGYGALQATGPANVPESNVDHALAWCPAAEDEGMEWIELRYEKPVFSAEVRIHASFNPGAVERVLVGTTEGNWRVLWTGTSPAEPIQIISISPAEEISRIKLELNTAKVPGWNQIDAVALIDPTGAPVWADAATSSSYWNQPANPPAE